MTDLIKRLELKRDVWRGTEFGDDICELLDEAADTLEALRAEVESVTCELMDAITRADKLAETLALLPDDSGMVEHSPEEGPFMFCCGREVTFDRLHGPICTHDEECWYARMRALRDHDQEDRSDC